MHIARVPKFSRLPFSKECQKNSKMSMQCEHRIFYQNKYQKKFKMSIFLFN